MYKHYLKTIFRNVYRDKYYALINVSGLAVAIASCIIIGIYLAGEITYDRHFQQHKRIYRVASELNVDGNVNLFSKTSYALAPLLENMSADIEAFVRFSFPSNNAYKIFQHEDSSFTWDDVVFVDSNIFEVFSHEIVYGDPETALDQPNTIAISERFSRSVFGEENPVGESLRGGVSDYVVNLVFADLPSNTHLKYDVLISYQGQPSVRLNPTLTDRVRHDLWYGRTDFSYVLMAQQTGSKTFANTSEQFFNQTMSSYEASFSSTVRFFLEPLKDIHLKSQTQGDKARGSIFYVVALSAIAVFILAVASINYMILSTARFSRHAKSVAVHNLLGARRYQLVFQFLLESIVFSAIGLLVGLLLADIVLDYTSINFLFARDLSTSILSQPLPMTLLIVGTLVLGLIAGLYPAMTMSRLGRMSEIRVQGVFVRQALLFLQFLVSICVISSALLMFLQVKYLEEKPLGFEKERKIMLTVTGAENIERIPAFKNELEQNNNIMDVSSSIGGFGGTIGFGQAEVEGRDGSFETQSYNWYYIDEDYVDTMGITITEGRNFDPDNRNDVNNAVLVNETLVRKMAWDEPLGKGIRYDQGIINVIGVMQDFHFQGLQNEVEAIMFWLSPPVDFSNMSEKVRSLQSRNLLVSIAEENYSETLSFIEQSWKRHNTSQPYDYKLLGDYLDELYTSDLNQMKLVSIFAGLCIFVSCLGLIGLTAFVIEQKTKEIGIRKVLGAAVWQIMTMLFKNVLLLIVLAAIAASFLSYWLINQWLQGFHYHTDISVLVFLMATALIALVAFLTMVGASFGAAHKNPILALRSE
ncbi:MAG: hypothetical protein COB20_08720 [SAR86 cluster bacterium]|uniref:ABC transporter permease n=1 Tax=SAR86 cluster bacterium TaxID=2030880 RepID=A0A2A4X524_9GAMM|nr:MAG: hypothetical protein COB20_08720 [SAR86 cluster bacterium]